MHCLALKTYSALGTGGAIASRILAVIKVKPSPYEGLGLLLSPSCFLLLTTALLYLQKMYTTNKPTSSAGPVKRSTFHLKICQK